MDTFYMPPRSLKLGCGSRSFSSSATKLISHEAHINVQKTVTVSQKQATCIKSLRSTDARVRSLPHPSFGVAVVLKQAVQKRNK